MSGYDPSEFWQRLHSTRADLTGVGHGGYGPRYNRFLYRAKERAFSRALAPNGIELGGRNVLDVGWGVGYFAGVAYALGVASLHGPGHHGCSTSRTTSSIGREDVVPAGLAVHHVVFHKRGGYERLLFGRDGFELLD